LTKAVTLRTLNTPVLTYSFTPSNHYVVLSLGMCSQPISFDIPLRANHKYNNGALVAAICIHRQAHVCLYIKHT